MKTPLVSTSALQMKILSINILSLLLSQSKKSAEDDKLKACLKIKLDNDEYCANQLQKLKDNNISYDNLWNEKLYSTKIYSLSSGLTGLCPLEITGLRMLETIFDVKYLSTKIDTEVIELWKDIIERNKQDNENEQYEKKKEVQDSLQHSEYTFTDKELYNLY
ncbi:9050_t:CDS:2 [Funneliformis caledonium]|uniref:9050_t:CDS:1 n=1 Tax=Funneliformis caledonium TaxID=1117310 RepID=A0A9N9CEE1_9GLOM|nr:9050_t:CDS:2 [Funneliformis caledonium]